MSSILRLPLRVAGRAADLALLPVRLVGTVVERVAGRDGVPHTQAPGPPPPPRPETRAPAPRTRPAPTRAPDAGPSPPPAAPAESFTEGPAAGAAFAPPEPTIAAVGEERLRRREEERTEDSPGAEVHVDEPWSGYRDMAAPDIVDRLVLADAAERAVVLLYEQSHRGRKMVLEAARQEP